MTQRTGTGSGTRLLQGLAAGALAMYLLDPDKGRRRRALLRDRLNRIGCDIADLAHDAARDTTNRLQGVRARVDRRSSGDGAVDELRLIERVRSALGRIVSHPHAVQVGAFQGTIRLSGPVLAHELPALLVTVRSVPGVTGVESHLDAHALADIPALQGQRRERRGQDYAMPAARLSTLITGGMLALYALRKDGLLRLAAVAAGIALGNRALYGTPGRGHAGNAGAHGETQGSDDEQVIHAGRARGNGASAHTPATDAPQTSTRPPATH